MPEHEPLDISDRDKVSADKPEARAARIERDTQAAGRERPAESRPGTTRSDDAQAASEPMELQRLAESKTQVPPGRQRTGDPPSPSRRE
jgi:hypothetical protein